MKIISSGYDCVLVDKCCPPLLVPIATPTVFEAHFSQLPTLYSHRWEAKKWETWSSPVTGEYEVPFRVLMGFQGANFDTINVLKSPPHLSLHLNYCKFSGEFIYTHKYT